MEQLNNTFIVTSTEPKTQMNVFSFVFPNQIEQEGERGAGGRARGMAVAGEGRDGGGFWSIGERRRPFKLP